MKQPTIYHITHPKAGSQWIRQVLTECAPNRVVQPLDYGHQFFLKPIKIGRIYPCIYVGKGLFDTIARLDTKNNQIQKFKKEYPQLFSRFVIAWNWWNFRLLKHPHKIFVVVRDLRDTMVSLYFSLKTSHPLRENIHQEYRDKLNALDKDAGFIYLMDEYDHLKNIQITWQVENVLHISYEELLSEEYAGFERIINYCEINIDKDHLHEIVKRNSFEMMTNRKQGEEDEHSHYRKGIVGDWHNHFSPVIKRVFKQRFGDTLIQLGYEKDLDW